MEVKKRAHAEVRYLLSARGGREVIIVSKTHPPLIKLALKRGQVGVVATTELANAIVGKAVFSIKVKETMETVFDEKVTLSTGQLVYQNLLLFFEKSEDSCVKSVTDTLLTIVNASKYLGMKILAISDIGFYARGGIQ